MPKKLHIDLPNNQQFFSIKELKDMGLSYYGIKKLVMEEKLIKLNNHCYENTLYQGEELDFYYVFAYAPQGVICQMSAAQYYGLTSYWPNEIDVAIERTKKISTLPQWPKFNVIYYSDKRFEMGINEIQEGKNVFRIYDIEKTVIDIIYYRNKIGIEEMKEVLINYLHREDRNLNRLHCYAKQLHCEKILRTYLEVLL